MTSAGSHSSADLTAALSQSDAAGSFRIEFIVGLRFSAISSVYYFPVLKSNDYWIAGGKYMRHGCDMDGDVRRNPPRLIPR
jgi:hypothetical protein